MTYGTYQEAACRAFLGLVEGAEPGPCSQSTVAILRAHVLVTLSERLEHLGCDRQAVGYPTQRTSHVALARHPSVHLGRLVAEMEQREWLTVAAPSDVLRGVSCDPAVDLWRLAARSLFLATSELQRSAQQPWLTRPAVAWPLIADAAEVIEAVSLLDARLSATPSHPVPKRDLLTHLLVASDVSRIARMMRTDSSADVATAGWGAFTSDDGPPITLVRTASDWATAQRRLAGFVRPHLDPEGRVAVRDQPGLKAARVLATGQTMLNHAFARWAQQAGERALADSFRSRVDLYQRLHASMTQMVDLAPHRSPLPTLQQSEMVTRLRTRPEERLSLAQLGALNEATHELTVELGKALRREAMARGRLQTLVAAAEGLHIPRPITTTRHPFYVACKALADAPPPPCDAMVQMDRSARLRLAASLRTASFRTPTRTI